MLIRRLFIVLAVGLVAAACAGATGPALEVNGTSFSRSEINDFLLDINDEIAEDEDAIEVIGSATGTMQSDVVASVLDVVIQNELMKQQMDSIGASITQADIDAVTPTIPVTGFDTFDQLFGEMNARLLLVSVQDVQELALEADVQLDPKYGQWFDGQVIPNFVPLDTGS